ncbi:MAG: UDP-N-acetylmuramate dehydrogenase [Pyramidobacter sp.]|jgi:UDP-N-acetylmuramate dehydrogenase
MNPTLESALADGGLPWERGVSLRTLSCWRIGGKADYLVKPRNAEETALACHAAREANMPFLVIGHGSNILFDDAGFRGVIVKIGSAFARWDFDGTTVRADAGLWAPSLARLCADRGLAGLEHAAGIPGNLGGLLYMNGGSMRRNIGDCVTWVQAMAPDGTIKKFSRDDCEFSYRRSVFQRSRWIILGAELQLRQSSAKDVRKAMLDVLEERRRKFPLELPNCGSVFSNDAQLYERFGPPGMIIDKAGLKGTRVGGAEVSGKHGNFIVNVGGASSSDVFALVKKVRDKVRELTGFTLRTEVLYLSPDGCHGPLSGFLD